MRKAVIAILIIIAVAAVALWFLSAPRTLAANDLPQHTADLTNGAYIFWAGGCSSCHAAKDAKGDDLLKLGGGRVFDTPFGRFHVPNISPDKDTGIGGWSTLQFANAMKLGVRPDSAHLYPAFPYTSYQRMTLEDVIDLKAYLDTLPAIANRVPDHELAFPYNIRRGIGLWKLLYVDGVTFRPDPKASAAVNRGAYLIDGPAHCGECHTPRDLFGGPEFDKAMSGAPSLVSRGYVSNITTDPDTGIGKWSADDIVQLLETGFKPDFDAVGGAMGEVVTNTAKLTADDRAAMAAYLKALPPIHKERPPRRQPPAANSGGGG